MSFGIGNGPLHESLERERQGERIGRFQSKLIFGG